MLQLGQLYSIITRQGTRIYVSCSARESFDAVSVKHYATDTTIVIKLKRFLVNGAINWRRKIMVRVGRASEHYN